MAEIVDWSQTANFTDVSKLPIMLIDGVEVNFAGHHVIPQSVFNGSEFFSALQQNNLFDGNRFKSNGVGLPATGDGATVTGSAYHAGNHPAYNDWIKARIVEFEVAYENRNFDGLSKVDWLKARADLDALLYNRAQAALDAEVARVLLGRNADEPIHAPAGADPVLVEHSGNQARREIEKHLAAVAGYEADIEQKTAALGANEAQIERARLTIPLLEEKNATAKGLYDKRFGARPPVLESEQQLVEKRAELKTALHNVHQIEAEIRSLRAKLAEARAGYLADATDRRTKALMKVAQLGQDITKARQKESYRRLVSPVAGTVQGLKIHTPGAVVTTADTLMTIVPDGTGIEVDSLVLNKDIGFVQEGQDVEVKLEAFPFTRYGLVRGRVRKLGRDAATNPNAPPGAAVALMASAPSPGPAGAATGGARLSDPGHAAAGLDRGRRPARADPPWHARLRRDQDRRPARDRISALAGDAGGARSREGKVRS